MDIAKLTDEIIAGRRLNKNDDLNDFITVDLERFSQGADKLRKAFIGNGSRNNLNVISLCCLYYD